MSEQKHDGRARIHPQRLPKRLRKLHARGGSPVLDEVRTLLEQAKVALRRGHHKKADALFTQAEELLGIEAVDEEGDA